MEEAEGTQMEGRGAQERDALTREANRLVEERGADGSSYFGRDLVGLRPAGGARISVAGQDLVRAQEVVSLSTHPTVVE